MKFFAVFTTLLAVAMASPATWTIPELSAALQDPNTDAFLIPLLEEALNEAMLAAFTGSAEPVATVSTVVQDFSSWTLHELSEAMQDPATDPALIPYLEHALNTMMVALMSGQPMETIIIGTPIGLLPVETVVAPEVVVPSPVAVAPVEAPVEASASSPLVQIIINVKSQQPQQEQDAPVYLPLPAPVEVPESAVNPIDVIAVGAPQINPIDILAPLPVVNPVGAGVAVVGPIV